MKRSLFRRWNLGNYNWNNNKIAKSIITDANKPAQLTKLAFVE
jgi:hypothetical protein